MNISLKEELILMQMTGFSYKSRYNYWQWRIRQETNGESFFPCFIQRLYQFFRADLQCLDKIKQVSQFSAWSLLRSWQAQSLMIGEPAYPKLWYEINQPPLIMYYQGCLPILAKPLISIVGTRQITSYGQEICQRLVQSIIECGWVCVSGLAKGIDACVHQTALSYQDQSTIAIIPSGWDKIYPSAHQSLADHLRAKHLVLSEFLPDWPARKHQFIMRNRLLAGIAPVTLVIEAAKRSGSLITANFALQANREVMALPGRITDKQAQGCNQLIEAGACPILSVEQVLDELSSLLYRQGYLKVDQE
ncbi:DNA-processing protein DprA [Ignavigranum ruoffiae]|uniref:DNA-processing protein DprA n=1 Tax=Ignavigranum ruoffiae TaxID=89093 RepID=UPI00205A8494|nr:DNA-processing protein DprA [Ignavigranum ruoffiae]UPQ85500.1 DNA-processing protein DprA [Ignavigranum ruoffiae]